MPSRVMVFDRAGKPLAEIDTNVTRSWILNRGEGSDIGRGEFAIAKTDPKCKEANLQFGNLVVVEHNKLPIWAGVIDPPRSEGNGIMTVTMFAAEKLLSFRRGKSQLKITATPGAIFREILRNANAAGEIAIVPGEIYEGGKTISEVVNLSDLQNETKRIASVTGCEWDITPALNDKGLLVLQGNWYQRQGVDRQFELSEYNTEAGAPICVEQGEIINELLGYDQSATWDSKATFTARDEASIALYGLRQGTQAFDLDKKLGTLETQTRNSLKPYPRRTYRLVGLDKGDTWGNLRIGDTLPFNRADVGFSGLSVRVRVIGMALTDSTGRLILTVDEVN